MQDAEEVIVVTGEGEQLAVRQDHRIQPDEQPMLGDAGLSRGNAVKVRMAARISGAFAVEFPPRLAEPVACRVPPGKASRSRRRIQMVLRTGSRLVHAKCHAESR